MTKRTALITGGAGGLGRALDTCLRARGWFTVLIDLPGPSLEAIEVAENRSVYGCDLTDQAELRKVCGKIRETRPSIDLVIYNAGITHIGPFSDAQINSHRRVFEINYFAVIEMVRELQADVRKARGTHLALSSVAGFAALHHRTAYSASKHALEGFMKSLRSEELPHGVRCVIAAPSFVATNLGKGDKKADGTARPGSASDGMDYMSPDDAAEIIICGWENGKNFIPVGRVARFSYWINRLSPNLFEKLMRRNIRKEPD